MSTAEQRKAFKDARRSYLLAGGKGVGRLATLLDAEFDTLPQCPLRSNGELMDLVDIYKRQEA